MLWISSFTIILRFPENNSLNLSKIIVGKYDDFKIKEEAPKITVKNSQ